MKKEIIRLGVKRYVMDNCYMWPSNPSKFQQRNKSVYESRIPRGTIQNTCFSSHFAAGVQAYGPGPPR